MPAWTAPTLADVAAWIPSRTNNALNVRQNTFNDDTQPTDDQATALIAMAKSHVESQVGSDLCDAIVETKPKGVTALYAAMLIELTYFPEQVAKDLSPYKQLKELYDEQLKQLRSDVEEECGDVPGSTDPEGGTQHNPVYDFSVSTRPLGREIVW